MKYIILKTVLVSILIAILFGSFVIPIGVSNWGWEGAWMDQMFAISMTILIACVLWFAAIGFLDL